MVRQSLRILRIVQSTYPEVVGGVGIHVHEMSKLQAEMGHEVTVLTSDNGDRRLPRQETRDSYTLIRHREVARPFDNSITPGLLRSLRTHAPDHDILHVHSHLYFSSTLSALYDVLSDVPMVLTNHGLVSQTAPMPVQKLFIPTVGRFTFEAADRILCYTDTDKRRLLDRGIGTDISVIHNGIDCTQFEPNGAESNAQLLFVGRLKPGKGPQYLLEAFGTLASEYPGLSLKLVGDGPLRDDLAHQAATLNVEDRVTFLGEVSNEELPRLYNESLAFVLPSLNEGLPRTVLEAMACGRPVITSDLEQLRSIVPGAGYLVEPGSTDELVDTISKLLESTDLAAFGENARSTVESEYSWRDTVEQTVKSYRTVIE